MKPNDLTKCSICGEPFSLDTKTTEIVQHMIDKHRDKIEIQFKVIPTTEPVWALGPQPQTQQQNNTDTPNTEPIKPVIEKKPYVTIQGVQPQEPKSIFRTKKFIGFGVSMAVLVGVLSYFYLFT